MTSALNRQTAASALSRAITIGARLASRPTGRPAGLARQRGTTQQGLGQGELDVGRVGRGPDQERAVLVRPVDVVHDAHRRTGRGLLRQAHLEGGRVVHRDDRVLGAGQAERAALHAVVERLDVVAPEQAGGEGGVEGREGRGDLGLQDRRVVDRLQRAGTQRAGDARARPRYSGASARSRRSGCPGHRRRSRGRPRSCPGRSGSPPASVIGQISCASGSLVVRGLATLGNCIGSVAAQEVGLLDLLVLQRDSPQVVMRDRLGLVDVGKPLATGGEHPGREHCRPKPPVPAYGQSHGQPSLTKIAM